MSHSDSLGEVSKEVKSETRLNTKMAARGTRIDLYDVIIINKGTIIAEVLPTTRPASLSKRSEVTEIVNLTTTTKIWRVISSVDKWTVSST